MKLLKNSVQDGVGFFTDSHTPELPMGVMLRRLVFAVLVAVTAMACEGGATFSNNNGSNSDEANNTTTDGGETETENEPEVAPPEEPVVTANLNKLSTRDIASRFFSRAGFGATDETIDAWLGMDAADWLKAEFAKPPELLLPVAKANYGGRLGPTFRAHNRYYLMRQLMESPAELRTKMTYALSQILVVGGDLVSAYGIHHTRGITYRDKLHVNAFGNFRKLINDITYSTAMAEWLTYIGSYGSTEESSRQPDENYAREILQLFTIGLWELNQDGTRKLDADGNPIETYDSEDITNLARVFTGLTYDTDRAFDPGEYQYVRAVDFMPLIVWSQFHDNREKVFLDTYIPANTDSATSIKMALDGIVAHANVAPFISRQLIQRFTASNPSPAYIERVANAFSSGTYTSANGTTFGTNESGDLEATMAAILLDESLYWEGMANNHEGKAREPMLKILHWIRAYDVQNLDFLLETKLNNTSGWGGMKYFQANSVFNFYRPGYVAPGTESAKKGMTVPELQIATSTNIVDYMGLASSVVLEKLPISDCKAETDKTFVWSGEKPCQLSTEEGQKFAPDYSNELALASDSKGLVQHLNTKLAGGTMSDTTINEIIATIELIPLSTDEEAETRLRERVQIAILMTMTAPSFSVSY